MKTVPLVERCTPIVRPMLSEVEADELERLFRALADRSRVRILNLLAGAEDALCVCDLVATLEQSQPLVSYHLRQLLEIGLVERERRGTYSYYRLAGNALERVGAIFAPAQPLKAAV